MPADEEGDRDRREASQWYRLSATGFEFAASILIFGGIGWYLDERWNTTPWLMLIGGGTGFAVGLWLLVRMAMQMFRE